MLYAKEFNDVKRKFAENLQDVVGRDSLEQVRPPYTSGHMRKHQEIANWEQKANWPNLQVTGVLMEDFWAYRTGRNYSYYL